MIKMVNVKIYSTPTCPYCKLAKEFFKEKNISFTKKTECDRPKRFDLSRKIVMPIVSLNHPKR